MNASIKIFHKTGHALNGVNGTTYNSFFSAMGPTRGTRIGLVEIYDLRWDLKRRWRE